MTSYAISYCRVSSAEQVEGSSLGEQEKANRAYIERQGWKLDAVFIEAGESARTADRPQLIQALEHRRRNAGRVSFMVVHRLDRFARNQFDHFALRAKLQELGVSLRASEQGIDETAEGRLMEGMLAAFAQFDNDLRRDRCSAGMRAALKDGRWLFCPPLGYRSSADRSIEPDPQAGPLVRRAFELVAQGLPMPEAVAKLRAMGLRTQRGNQLDINGLHRILRNPLYCGRIVVKPWGVDRKGSFKPLVSQQLFDQVQEVLDGRGRGRGLATYQMVHPDFPLRRFVRCSSCGQPLTGAWSQGKNRRYGYYWCTSKDCRRRRVRRSVLEDLFLDHMEQIAPSPGEVRVFEDLVREEWAETSKASENDGVRVAREIAALEEQRERLLSAYLAKALPLEELQQARERLDVRLRETRRASRQCSTVAAEDLDELLRFARSVVCDLPMLWRSLETPQKRELQDVIFPAGAILDTAALRIRTPEKAPFPGVCKREGSSSPKAADRGFRTPEDAAAVGVLSDSGMRGLKVVAHRGFEPLLPA